MIILIGGEKGGGGKSCLAQNIAVHLRTEQGATVLLVDCDPQRTTSDWIQERNFSEQLPNINCVQLYGKIRNELMSLSSHYDYVVIDCGSQDELALKSSISVADHVLVPLRPKRRDLKTVPHMEDMIASARITNPVLNAAFIITQCPKSETCAARIQEAKDVCHSFNVEVLNAVTFNRHIYDDSEECGESVIEAQPTGDAANEIRELVEELLSRPHYSIEQDNGLSKFDQYAMS